jgi:hypothetical protein
VHTARPALVLVALLIGACATESAPTEETTITSPPSTTPREPIELTSGGGPLPPGTYTRRGFLPSVTFAVEADGWFPGTLNDGFFDIQQDRGTPDVVAVQFALVLAVVGDGGAMSPATTAGEAAAAIKLNPGLVVLGESAAGLGGLEGWAVEVENTGDTTSAVMRVAPGTLSFDPNRRLWISLFDTGEGIMAVIVGGSVAEWDRALALAQPVMETIVITGS